MGYAPGLNDVPEEIEIREIEPHEGLPSYSTKAGYAKGILQRQISRFKLRKSRSNGFGLGVKC
jgi:hypothetical protein